MGLAKLIYSQARSAAANWLYYWRVRKVHRAIQAHPLKLPLEREIAPFQLDDVLANFLTEHVDRRWDQYMDILRTSSLQAMKDSGYVLVREPCTLPVEAPLFLRRPPTEAEQAADKKTSVEPWVGNLQRK